MEKKYKKALIKFYIYLALAILWTLSIPVCAYFFHGKFEELGLLGKSVVIAIILYAVAIVISFTKYVSTKEFQDYEAYLRKLKDEKMKIKDDLNKKAFYEKRVFYYITIPILIIWWYCSTFWGDNDIRSNCYMFVFFILLAIFSIFIVTCIVLWQMKKDTRK